MIHMKYCIDSLEIMWCTVCTCIDFTQVDALYEGKGAIHMAALEGYLPILRLLISHRANLNKKVTHIILYSQQRFTHITLVYNIYEDHMMSCITLCV